MLTARYCHSKWYCRGLRLFLGGPFLFETFGAIYELVVLRGALDAFVFVWAGVQVAGAFVVPIKAHIWFLF